MFEIKDEDLAARIGRLKTPRGYLETPALLPVINPFKSEISINKIKEIGFKALITNAYILYRRDKEKLEKLGIHNYFGFDGIIMTDSGAYQMLRYGKVNISNNEIIEFQKLIGSDIAVILDTPTPINATREEAVNSVEETLRKAQEAIELIEDDDRLWTLPIQGGKYIELVESSAVRSRELLKYFNLIALGSPVEHLEEYDFSTVIKMIISAKKHLPRGKPLHLFGAGHPAFFALAIALGVDMFDSASYILYARDNRYMTPIGTERIERMKELPCSCPVCNSLNVNELIAFDRSKRTELIAVHNLYVIKNELNDIKNAIREGRLWEYIRIKAMSHPKLFEAFKQILQAIDIVEKYDPRTKGSERGIFLFDEFDLNRVEIRRYRRFLKDKLNYKILEKKNIVLFPAINRTKPFSISKRERLRISKMLNDKNFAVMYYLPYFGVIPENLVNVYPLSQNEFVINDNLIKEMMGFLEEYLKFISPIANSIYLIIY